jgi:hypothetical protein
VGRAASRGASPATQSNEQQDEQPDQQRWVVDSIEEGVAAIEADGERMIRVPRWLLPPEAREGLVLRARRAAAADGERVTITVDIDRAATTAALGRSRAQVERARRVSKDPGGDVTL